MYGGHTLEGFVPMNTSSATTHILRVVSVEVCLRTCQRMSRPSRLRNSFCSFPFLPKDDLVTPTIRLVQNETSCVKTTIVIIVAKLEISGEEPAGYALSLVSSADQMCIVFKGTIADEEKEDMFEVNGDDVIQAHFSSQKTDLGDISICVADLDASDDWVLVKPQEGDVSGYVLTVKVNVMERAPNDWFSVGISALSHLPWYLKAEDLYRLTKHILQEYHISTSTPVTKLCGIIDNASVVIASNVLSLRVEEGFSVIRQLDDLLEKVFAASDEKVDTGLLQLARSLQRLRRTVTRRVEGLSDSTRQQMVALHGKAADAGGIAQERYQSTVHNAYYWAVERTEETSQWVHSESDGLVSRLNGLTMRGQAVVKDTTARLADAPREVVERVRSDVSSRIAEATERAKGLPEKAHPYVVGAVGVTQPYIASAVETAGPYVQSLREKAAPVEEWLHGTKDAVEKKYPAVASAAQQAQHVLGEVVGYCTDDKYFEHKRAQERQTEGEAVREVAASPEEKEDTQHGTPSPGPDFMTIVQSPVTSF